MLSNFVEETHNLHVKENNLTIIFEKINKRIFIFFLLFFRENKNNQNINRSFVALVQS